MPLIIISGRPCSGKTTRAYELKEYFENIHKKKVDLISEADAIEKLGYEKNSFYLDSQKEKRVRGLLKSEVIRLIGKEDVVILDAANYIKGYRYELYCASKASKSTQCTLYTIANVDKSWCFNERRQQKTKSTDCTETKKLNKDVNVEKLTEDIEKLPLSEPIKMFGGFNDVPYSKEIFDGLIMRYEEPNSHNRWDSPLFTKQPEDDLELEDFYKVLYEKKPPPPNMSTQNPPLSSTNFLFELDRITQDITKRIVEAKNMNLESDLKFPEYPKFVLESASLQFSNGPMLLKLRRQFLTYAKMQYANEEPTKIGGFFLQYLNTTLQE